MNAPEAGPDFVAARQAARTCAVAGQLQRDLRERTSRCGDVFTAKPFDDALFSTFSLAIAFSAPELDSGRLRPTSRACLWSVGLDWLIDHVADSAAEVAGLADRCLAVGGGAAPEAGDDFGEFLADIRDELGTAEGFAALRGVWLDELRRLLGAMATEWTWKSTGTRPTLDVYLSNADNTGFTFVYMSHVIATVTPAPLRDLPELLEAGREVQRVIRLLNDFAGHERDVAWGDLNALLLGVDRERVRERLAELAARAQGLIGALRDRQPAAAGYMERQLGFCTGFYGVSDFWGRL